MGVGAVDVRFNKGTGEIDCVLVSGRPISLVKGPRFIAARRADRNPDGTVNPRAEKSAGREYADVSGSSALTSLSYRTDSDSVVVEADYSGPLHRALWKFSPDGDVRLDYEYGFDGVVDLAGVHFDYPEDDMHSIRWLGMGPYRFWQNRMKGTTLDVWQNAYNDTTPGQTFVYPEFKGYFRDWRWAVFSTAEGNITMTNESGGPFLGVYTPKDGKVGPLAVLPPGGLAVLDVIPAMRNKVNAADLLGPQSQAPLLSETRHGTVHFRFGPR